MEMTWKGHQRMKTLILLVWYCISFTGYIASISYAESVGIIENQDDKANELIDVDEERSKSPLKIESDVNGISPEISDIPNIDGTETTDEAENDAIDKLYTKDEYKETIIEKEEEGQDSIEPDLSHLGEKMKDDSSRDSNMDTVKTENEFSSLKENDSDEAADNSIIKTESNKDPHLVLESGKEQLIEETDDSQPNEEVLTQATNVVDEMGHIMDKIPDSTEKDSNVDAYIVEVQEIRNSESDANGDQEASVRNEDIDETIETENSRSITQTELHVITESDETKQKDASQDEEENITDGHEEDTDVQSTKNDDDDDQNMSTEIKDVVGVIEKNMDTYKDEETYDLQMSDYDQSPVNESNNNVDDTEEIKTDEKVEEAKQQIEIEDLIDDTQIPQPDSNIHSHSHTEQVMPDIQISPDKIIPGDSGKKNNGKLLNENLQTQIEDISSYPKETTDEVPVPESVLSYEKNPDTVDKGSNKVGDKDMDQNKENQHKIETAKSNLLKDRQEAAKMDQNIQFVQGLTDIDKFLEEVDPPDELDVGAAGSSIQDVLMSQGVQIIKTRVSKGVQYVRKKVFKPIKDRVASTLNRKNDLDDDNYGDYEDDENYTDYVDTVQNDDGGIHDYAVVDDDDDGDDEPRFSLNFRTVKEALNITKISNGVIQLVERNKGRLRKIQQIIRRVAHRIELILDKLGFLSNDDFDEDNNDEFDAEYESNQKNGKAHAFESLNLDQMRRKVMETRGTSAHSTNGGNHPKRDNILNGIGSTMGSGKEREISDELQNMLKSRYQAKMKEREESKVEIENES